MKHIVNKLIAVLKILESKNKPSLILWHSFVAWLPWPMLVLQIHRLKGLSATVSLV